MGHKSSLVTWLVQLRREIEDDRVTDGSAALAFYAMLALFPAAIFALSLLPYLPIPNLRQAIFDLLYQLLPTSTAALLTDTVRDVMRQRSSGLLSFGLAFAIWSASSGVYAAMQQLNSVYGVREARPFWKARAIALLLMLMFFVLTVVTFGLAIFGGMVQDWAADRLGWSAGLRVLFAILRWLMIVLALLSAFAVVYRIAPNVRHHMPWWSAGNLVATAGFLLASFGFKLYVSHFGNYAVTYGGLGAAIVLLLWLFIVSFVLLLGGEINQLILSRRQSADR